MTIRCGNCGIELEPPRKKWCSDECSRAAARTRRLDQHFNITPAEYDQILEEQHGVCAICGKPPKENKRLAVDHDHKTGYVRGLLDFRCNKVILGARGDWLLVKAAEYITDPPAPRALGRNVIAPGRPAKTRARAKRRPRARHPRKAVK